MVTKPLTATVVIAVYNDWQTLECILQSLKTQWHHQFDVAIADDGSKTAFVEHVTRAQQHGYPFKISHYWQVDDGFGKTIVLNQAVAHTQAPYLIFIDGDCVPQTGFVDDHLRLARPGQCLTGRRIDLPHTALSKLDMRHPESIFSRNRARLAYMSLIKRARNIEKGFRVAWSELNLFSHKDRGIIGCNFSLYRQDLLAINGFDERFRAQWGAEDSDVDRRLRMRGIKVRSLFMCATMVHFDLSYDKRALWAINPPNANMPKYYDSVAAEGQSYTNFGIIKK
jgi:glycosyltransferase involved in cell wall biosynthesis